MVTYNDLRDWIAANKGEEVALLLDRNVVSETIRDKDVSLSEKLLGSFIFCASPEGDEFWYDIYDELVRSENGEQRNTLNANDNDESGQTEEESE